MRAYRRSGVSGMRAIRHSDEIIATNSAMTAANSSGPPSTSARTAALCAWKPPSVRRWEPTGRRGLTNTVDSSPQPVSGRLSYSSSRPRQFASRQP